MVTRVPIDPLFLAVCEPATIVPVSLVPTLIVKFAARIESDNMLVIEVDEAVPGLSVNIKLSGRRRSHNYRFPRYTAEQMRTNEQFWAQAHGT